MKVNYLLSALTLASLGSSADVSVTNTATVTPSAEVVSLYTDAAGSLTSSTLTTLKYSKAIAEYGAKDNVTVITTIGPSHAATTVTTTTDTHKYGRFDHTSKSSSSSSSGTHKYGRFDHTSGEPKSSSTGTHKYGRFDKTDAGTATAVIKDASANGAAQYFQSYSYGLAALVAAVLAC